jgi:methylated-DNA-[protein]-cysteine S-methyltransferase
LIMNQSNEIWLGAARETPLGVVWTAVSAIGLVAVSIDSDEAEFKRQVRHLTGVWGLANEARTATAVAQLAAYLQGQQRDFDLPIDWSRLTPFQQEVLTAVCAVPYGATATYGEIARRIGRDKGSARAVGRANATNPMPLVIPCHRILGNDGRLQGYGGGGGLATKAWLLKLEGSRLL